MPVPGASRRYRAKLEVAKTAAEEGAHHEAAIHSWTLLHIPEAGREENQATKGVDEGATELCTGTRASM